MADGARSRPKLPLSVRAHEWVSEHIPWEFRVPFVALGAAALAVWLFQGISEPTSGMTRWIAGLVGGGAAGMLWGRELLQPPEREERGGALVAAGGIAVAGSALHRLLPGDAQVVLVSLIAGFLVVSAVGLLSLIPVRYRQERSTWHDRAREKAENR